MPRETRIIGGIVIPKPSSVRGLESIRATLASGRVEEALRMIDYEIENRWVIEGYWRHVQLELVTPDET
jgi:hypothetical protein